MLAHFVQTVLDDALAELTLLSAAGAASHVALVSIVLIGVAETMHRVGQQQGADQRTTLGEACTAAVMGLGGLAVGAAIAGLFVLVFGQLGHAAPRVLSDFWAEHRIVAFVAAFVAWDLVGHVYHRIGHGTALGWAAHRPHHTGTQFGLTLAWRQSWLPIHGVVLPFVAVGGWSLSTITICAAVSNVVQALQHSNSTMSFPQWLTAIFMTPVQHRRHHCRIDEQHHAVEPVNQPVNLGPVLTVWDRIAGTYDPTPVEVSSRYGVESTATNPVLLQLEGWRKLVRY